MKFIFNAATKGKTAIGKFKIYDKSGKRIFMCDAISGGWGKGYLPEGKYIAKYYREDNLLEGFKLFNIGFFVFLEPQFKTDRTEIGIHFDGKYEGTLACIGFKAKSRTEAIFFRKTIKNIMRMYEQVELDVVYNK